MKMAAMWCHLWAARPHAMALPERSVDPEALIDETRRAYQKYGFAVVVTTPTSTNTEGDWLDGQSLADRLSEELGVPAAL